MFACQTHDPAGLANPFVTHVNAALWWFALITFVASSEWVKLAWL